MGEKPGAQKPNDGSKGFWTSEVIERPPEAVWAYMSDLSNALAWMPGVDEIELISGGDGKGGPALGALYRSRVSTRGDREWVRSESEVTLWEPPKRMALTSTAGPVTATYTYEIEPDTYGSRVFLDVRCTATGFLMKLMHFFVVAAMKKVDGVQLQNLRDELEKD